MDNSIKIEKIKVLAVDDTEYNLELIDGILSSEKYEVSFASNGLEALKKIEEVKPDIILLDIAMPNMDGYEVCRRVKKNELTKDIPVIFLTAKAEIENIIEGFEMGGEDYITKPFSIEELMARIKVHADLAVAKKNIVAQNAQLIEYNENLSSILNLSEELFEKNIDAIFWIDEKGEIIKCNSAAAELFECKRGELIGDNQENLYYKEKKNNFERQKNKSIIETKIITKNGKVKSVRIHLTEISYNNQIIQQGTFVDITRQKIDELKIIDQNSQLQKLNATKDKFLSIIAHDLRGPIGSNNEMLKIIIEEMETMSVKEENIIMMMSEIGKSMENIYNLMENLLKWAMLQKVEESFNPIKTEIYLLISNSVKVLNPIAQSKNIKISINENISVPVFVDEQMMITVFRNLVSNAIKFTKDGGEVSIDVVKNRENCKIIIKDTGVGMTAKQVAKLFKTNTRVSTVGTREEKGTGLGLILCKEFVEKNGGKIKVESKEEEGSKFIVVLPYIKE